MRGTGHPRTPPPRHQGSAAPGGDPVPSHRPDGSADGRPRRGPARRLGTGTEMGMRMRRAKQQLKTSPTSPHPPPPQRQPGAQCPARAAGNDARPGPPLPPRPPEGRQPSPTGPGSAERPRRAAQTPLTAGAPPPAGEGNRGGPGPAAATHPRPPPPRPRSRRPPVAGVDPAGGAAAVVDVVHLPVVVPRLLPALGQRQLLPRHRRHRRPRCPIHRSAPRRGGGGGRPRGRAGPGLPSRGQRGAVRGPRRPQPRREAPPPPGSLTCRPRGGGGAEPAEAGRGARPRGGGGPGRAAGEPAVGPAAREAPAPHASISCSAGGGPASPGAAPPPRPGSAPWAAPRPLGPAPPRPTTGAPGGGCRFPKAPPRRSPHESAPCRRGGWGQLRRARGGPGDGSGVPGEGAAVMGRSGAGAGRELRRQKQRAAVSPTAVHTRAGGSAGSLGGEPPEAAGGGLLGAPGGGGGPLGARGPGTWTHPNPGDIPQPGRGPWPTAALPSGLRLDPRPSRDTPSSAGTLQQCRDPSAVQGPPGSSGTPGASWAPQRCCCCQAVFAGSK